MAQERLWVYRNTQAADYPLILVFGREANNVGPMNDVIGRYDFTLSPHSGFWNRAYGAVGRCAGFASAAQLKRRCNELDGSPIAFANSSPLALPYGLSDKDAPRSMAARELPQHVERVFQLADSELDRRIKLVVLGVGSDFILYGQALEAIQGQCRRRNVPLADLPHFGGRMSNQAMDASIGPRHRALIASILQEFAG